MARIKSTGENTTMIIVRGKTEATLAEAGFDQRKLEALDEYFHAQIAAGTLQGASYLLARRGKIFAQAAMGKLHFQTGGELRPDSLRLIGSITKLFTAVAVFQLWERGRFNLYEPVSAVLKEFDTPMHRGINPGQLLTHTSGLPADPWYFQEPYPVPLDQKPSSWIKYILQGPLQSEPGKAWSYSSAGFAILGEIIARVSGMSYAEYVKANILNPLGMEDTYFKVPPEKINRLCLARPEEIDWLKAWTDPESPYPPSYGNLISTLSDLNKLGQCLLENGRRGKDRIPEPWLLGRKSIEYLRRNQLRDVPAFYWGKLVKKFHYGMGVEIERDDFSTPSTYGHCGVGASFLFIDPENEFVGVVFAPTPLGMCPEAVDNPRAIIWSGLL